MHQGNDSLDLFRFAPHEAGDPVCIISVNGPAFGRLGGPVKQRPDHRGDNARCHASLSSNAKPFRVGRRPVP